MDNKIKIHKKNILLSIGKKTDKKILLSSINNLPNEQFLLYATQNTHYFLKQNNINSILVHKISEKNKKPNIKDLLTQNVFDIIINIPKHNSSNKTVTDGSLIRKESVECGITLVTHVNVAQHLINKLSSQGIKNANDTKKIDSNTLLEKYRYITHKGLSIKPTEWSYNIYKSYDWNYEHGPSFNGQYPQRENNFTSKKFLKFKVNSLFGVPAGPLLDSKWIGTYAKLGYDILTYKTVRTKSYSAHPMPHILYVEKNEKKSKKSQDFYGKPYLSKYDALTITNSFGVPSKDPDVWQDDVRKSLQLLSRGQLLIVSVMGTHEGLNTQKEFINDFAKCANLAIEAGAPIIEVNLSCPNLHTGGIVCYDIDLSAQICKQIKNVIGDISLIAKIGYYEDDKMLRNFIVQTNKYLDGIAAINTVKGNIKDLQIKKPHMRKLTSSGICGTYIKPYGIDMVSRLFKIRSEWKMNFSIIGIGGVTTPKDYEDYVVAGADAVQSGTGAMMNPYLAKQIYDNETRKKNEYTLVKSIGSSYFNSINGNVNIDSLKKLYMDMVFPKSLPEDQRTLMIREKPFELKHGESGRKTSHIYMNHRNLIYINAWDRRLLVLIFNTLIKNNVLKNNNNDQYGVVSITSSSSPELTALMLDLLSPRISRIVVTPDHILSQEKGAHSAFYGTIKTNSPLIMIDDVFTSGRSFRETLQLISKNTDKKDIYAVTHLCRNPDMGEKFSKETGCKLFYLTTLDEVLKYHWKNFSQKQKKLILKERPYLK